MPEDPIKGVSIVDFLDTKSKLADRSKVTNPRVFSNKSPPHTALAGLEQEEEEEVMTEAEVDLEEGAAQLHMEKVPHLNNNNNNNK